MALPVSVFAQTPEMSAALRKAPFRAANARTGWLGRLDSNQGMAVPKTAALPLGLLSSVQFHLMNTGYQRHPENEPPSDIAGASSQQVIFYCAVIRSR